jgi:hypothetical protein
MLEVIIKIWPILVLSAAIVLGVGGYLAYICLEAWTEVKALPREEMFLCHKHGPIKQEGTIDFFGQKACGLCFHEKLQAAEQGRPM